MTRTPREQWLPDHVTGWVHEDGTVCPETLAPVNSAPPTGWWCTRHQMYVRHPDENTEPQP